MLNNQWFATASMLLAIAAFSGCGSSAESTSDEETHAEHAAHEHAGHDHAEHEAAAGHEHGAWWCKEHGVPEGVCALCDPKLVAEFKAKGDWCKMHERPDSQCFVCHPERETEFAAQYEAKFGKQPPKPAS